MPNDFARKTSSTLSSQLPPNVASAEECQKRRTTEILCGFGLPLEEHEEYLVVLQGHLEMALEGYLSQFKRP